MPTYSNPLGLACVHIDNGNRPKVLVHIKMKLDVPEKCDSTRALESVRYDSMNKTVKSRSSLNQHRLFICCAILSSSFRSGVFRRAQEC